MVAITRQTTSSSLPRREAALALVNLGFEACVQKATSSRNRPKAIRQFLFDIGLSKGSESMDYLLLHAAAAVSQQEFETALRKYAEIARA